MAKCYIELPKAIERLFHSTPEGLEIHRAWIEEGSLVLDLRGPCVPDVQVVSPQTVMRSSVETVTWQRTETEFVGCSYVSEDGGTVLFAGSGGGGGGASLSGVTTLGPPDGVPALPAERLQRRWPEIEVAYETPALEYKDDEGVRESEDSFDNKGHTDGYGI